MKYHLSFTLSALGDRAAYILVLAAVAGRLGVGGQSDLFFAVVPLPLMLAAMLGEASFVLVLRLRGGFSAAEAFLHAAGETTATLALAFLLISGVVWLAADPLMWLLAPGFAADRHGEAVDLERIGAGVVFCQALGAALAAVLVGAGRVWEGTSRLPLANGVLALAIWAGGDRVHDARTVLLLMLASSAAIAAVLAGRVGALAGWRRILAWPASTQVGSLRSLALIGGANLAGNLWLLMERSLASTFAPGALTAIGLARTVLPLVGTIPSAVATSGYASAMAEENDGSARPRLARDIILSATVAGLPAAVFLVLRLDDIVAFLYQHGRFTAADTGTVAVIAMTYAAAIPHFILGSAFNKILQMVAADRTVLAIAWGGIAAYALFAAFLWGNGALTVQGVVVLSVVVLLGQTMVLGGCVVRRVGAAAFDLPYVRVLALALVLAAALATAGAAGPLLPLPLARLAAGGAVMALAGWWAARRLGLVEIFGGAGRR